MNKPDPYAAFRKWGRKGGLARAAKLSPERRREIAAAGGRARAKKRGRGKGREAKDGTGR